MKKLLNILLILCLLAVPVFAEEVETSGTCGENIIWEYADGVLTIEGEGLMDDFEEEAPWAAFKDEISRVVFSGGIEYIGARSFTDYDNLSTVNFGSALYEIGAEAFKGCDSLTVIYLPASFKVFGESSFNSCAGLTSIHCSGRFPSFRFNCLWNTYGKIYYPADKPWNVENIEQLETAFKGRIEFLASDGSDHYQPEEVTQPVTQPPTEPPTQPPTEPLPQPPTEAPTAAPTMVPTEAPAETTPVNTPQLEIETEIKLEGKPGTEIKEESKSWIGIVIIGVVAAFLLLGMIIVRISSRRGRYSKRRKRR